MTITITQEITLPDYPPCNLVPEGETLETLLKKLAKNRKTLPKKAVYSLKRLNYYKKYLEGDEKSSLFLF